MSVTSILNKLFKRMFIKKRKRVSDAHNILKCDFFIIKIANFTNNFFKLHLICNFISFSIHTHTKGATEDIKRVKTTLITFH